MNRKRIWFRIVVLTRALGHQPVLTGQEQVSLADPVTRPSDALYYS